MLGIFFVVLACLLWGIDGLIRYPLAASGQSAAKIVFSEHLLLVILMFPIVVKSFKRIWNAKFSHIVYFLILGGFGSALSTLCFTRAFNYIDPSQVIVLQKLQPLVAIFLAHFLLKEPIHKQFVIWALLCLIGAMLVVHSELQMVFFEGDKWQNMLSHKRGLIGLILALVAVVGWGSATAFGRKLSISGYEEKEIMSLRFSFGLLSLFPLLFSGAIELDLSATFVAKIFILVILSGLLGMFFYYRGLKLIPARLCTLVEMSYPFFAVVLNWIFLGARLDLFQICGGFVLLFASTIIQLKHY